MRHACTQPQVRGDPSKRLPKHVGVAVSCAGVTFFEEGAKVVPRVRDTLLADHDLNPTLELGGLG